MKRLRRPDLHAENKGFLGPSGRKRIARGKSPTAHNAQNASAPLSSHAQKDHKPKIVIREPKQYILVCLHSRDGALSNLGREVLYVGRVLAGTHTGYGGGGGHLWQDRGGLKKLRRRQSALL